MSDIFDQITLEEESPQGDIFDQISFEEKPSLKSEIGRHLARTTSRAAEAVGGLPGDLGRLLQAATRPVERGAAKIREKAGLKPLEDSERKPGLPGSEELREFSEKVFGDVVKPRSNKEAFIDEVIADTALLALPVKGKIPFVRSLGTSIAGNLAQEGVKELGVGEGGQAAAKVGTFFLGSILGKGSVKKFWNEKYKEAEKAIPSEALMDSNRLHRKLNNLQASLKKGGIKTPSQSFVEKPLKELKKLTGSGEMRVEDAVAAKKKINELRSSLFDEVKGRGGQKYARTRINDIANSLDDALEKYGKKNKSFYTPYKEANEAFAGYQQSKKLANWINRAIPFGKLGKNAIFIAEILMKPASLKVVAPALGAMKGGEIAFRMLANPTLRKYYRNILKDGISQNKAPFIKNLRKMEEELKKEDPDIFDLVSK